MISNMHSRMDSKVAGFVFARFLEIHQLIALYCVREIEE